MSSPTDTIRKDYIRKEDVHRKSKRVLYTQDEIDFDCCLSTEVPGMCANVRPPMWLQQNQPSVLEKTELPVRWTRAMFLSIRVETMVQPHPWESI